MQVFSLLFFLALTIARPPHIFFVLVDDLGYNDVGWHQEQPNPEIVTPMLDALVQEGVTLERHYVHPMCTPSRCSLQSGRLPVHVQVELDGTTEHGGIFRNMTTVATKMKQGGYATHFVGKWDAGMATPTHLPKGRGYDTSLFYFQHRNEYWTQRTTGDCFPPVVDLWNDTHPAVGLNGTAYEEIIFENAVSDIIRAHDPSIPLFLMYAPHLMHCPLAVPEEWYNKFDFMTNDESMCHGSDPWTPVPPSPPAPGYGCENCPTYVWPTQPKGLNTTCRRTYAAMINYLDTVVGNLTTLIKEKGMWNDTLMVFTADNGGPINIYENAANNYPLRGGKYSFFEGGVRAAAFVSGGYVPQEVRGTVNKDMMHITDWYATFSTIAGVDPTDTLAAKWNLPPIDSVNIWPVIAGTNKTSPRTEVFMFLNGLIVDNYKLLVGLQYPAGRQGPVFPNASSEVDDPTNVLLFCKDGCLFDVINDPYEYVDLATQQPDVLNKMKARLAELQPTFYVNNDTRHDTACTPINSTDPIADCFCWTAINVHGGFLGPYEEL